METRIPTPTKVLENLKGTKLSEEVLLGRGYFLCKFREVLNNSISYVKDIGFYPSELDEENELDEEDTNITSVDVKRYLSCNTPFCKDDDLTWIKCIPAEPEDVNSQEVYIAIAIKVKKENSYYIIQDMMMIARFVINGLYSIRGQANIESEWGIMPMFPPEAKFEIDQLIKGRFIPNNFSLIGKPVPENSSAFWTARNSGWRNVYTSIRISTDDNNNISDVEFDTYEREVSMFQRPYSMPDDYADMFDRILDYCDQYSDEEWKNILELHQSQS